MTSVKAKAIETELVIPGNNTTFTYLDISINLMYQILILYHIFQYYNYFFSSECSEKGKGTHIQPSSKSFAFQKKKRY